MEGGMTVRKVAVYMPKCAEDDGFGTLTDNLVSNADPDRVVYKVFRKPAGLVADCLSGGYDAVLFNGVSSGLIVWILKRLTKAKLIVRIGRIEKYGGFCGRTYERLALAVADIVVTDNRIVFDYILMKYGRRAEIIPNGGDHVRQAVDEDREKVILGEYGLAAGNYAIAEGCIVPESNCRMILDAFSRTCDKLVFVGDWSGGEYARKLKSEYGRCPNILMMPAPEDAETLYALRNGSRVMLHGYGEGDTTPSLLGKMWFGKPVVCFDSGYNREITRNQACYFTSMQDILRHVFVGGFSGKPMLTIASAAYVWKQAARKYEKIYEQ